MYRSLSALLILVAASTVHAAPASDGKAIGYVVASNQGQIDLSKIAQAKSKNAEIKEFAEHMIKVHEDRTVEFLKMATSVGVTPVGSADSKALDQALNEDKAVLNRESGPELDKTFMKQEIDHHQKVIAEIKGELLPSIQNSVVKSALANMLPRIAENLSKAQSLLAKLK